MVSGERECYSRRVSVVVTVGFLSYGSNSLMVARSRVSFIKLKKGFCGCGSRVSFTGFNNCFSGRGKQGFFDKVQ
jgi:hypothetical protein